MLLYARTLFEASCKLGSRGKHVNLRNLQHDLQAAQHYGASVVYVDTYENMKRQMAVRGSPVSEADSLGALRSEFEGPFCTRPRLCREVKGLISYLSTPIPGLRRTGSRLPCSSESELVDLDVEFFVEGKGSRGQKCCVIARSCWCGCGLSDRQTLAEIAVWMCDDNTEVNAYRLPGGGLLYKKDLRIKTLRELDRSTSSTQRVEDDWLAFFKEHILKQALRGSKGDIHRYVVLEQCSLPFYRCHHSPDPKWSRGHDMQEHQTHQRRGRRSGDAGRG